MIRLQSATFLLVGLCGVTACCADQGETDFARSGVGRSTSGLVHVDTRLDASRAFSDVDRTIAVRVAYVEGFGPATQMSDWLRSQYHLEELNVICVHLTDEDIDAILGLPRLTKLSLRGCHLSAGQIERLKQTPSVRDVDLHAVSLFPAGRLTHRE